MKVLNLQCSDGHAFEGWFASHDDYASQSERGLLTCPLCGDAQIVKLPSAPRLNLGRDSLPPPQLQHQPNTPPSHDSQAAPHLAKAASPPLHAQAATDPFAPEAHSAEAAAQATAQTTAHNLQAAWLKMARHVLANTEDVGKAFAQEARRMHYGECEPRSIRGQSSPQEVHDLLEEGIEVLPFALPDGLKEPLQ